MIETELYSGFTGLKSYRRAQTPKRKGEDIAEEAIWISYILHI